MAAQRFQRENWLGSRVDETQALAWPRYNVLVVDGVGAYYLTTEIPQLVKDAQCELALAMIGGWTGEQDDSLSATEIRTGVVKLALSAPAHLFGFPASVMVLIGRLITDVTIRRG
jgi:hypothetical protein